MDRRSVRDRYKQVLSHGDKTRSGRFSAREDEMVMRAVMEGRVEWKVWEDLGLLMDRKPRTVYMRWVHGIEHVLTRYGAGERIMMLMMMIC